MIKTEKNLRFQLKFKVTIVKKKNTRQQYFCMHIKIYISLNWLSFIKKKYKVISTTQTREVSLKLSHFKVFLWNKIVIIIIFSRKTTRMWRRAVRETLGVSPWNPSHHHSTIALTLAFLPKTPRTITVLRGLRVPLTHFYPPFQHLQMLRKPNGGQKWVNWAPLCRDTSVSRTANVAKTQRWAKMG